MAQPQLKSSPPASAYVPFDELNSFCRDLNCEIVVGSPLGTRPNRMQIRKLYHERGIDAEGSGLDYAASDTTGLAIYSTRDEVRDAIWLPSIHGNSILRAIMFHEYGHIAAMHDRLFCEEGFKLTRKQVFDQFQTTAATFMGLYGDEKVDDFLEADAWGRGFFVAALFDHTSRKADGVELGCAEAVTHYLSFLCQDDAYESEVQGDTIKEVSRFISAIDAQTLYKGKPKKDAASTLYNETIGRDLFHRFVGR